MSLRRSNPKRDENEPEIVAALELAGAKVERLSTKGLPDLLVCFRDRLYLVEVKMQRTKKPPKNRMKLLTAPQLKTATRFPVIVALTPNEALEGIGSPLRIG